MHTDACVPYLPHMAQLKHNCDALVATDLCSCCTMAKVLVLQLLCLGGCVLWQRLHHCCSHCEHVLIGYVSQGCIGVD